jgi:hypothetical protein
MKKIILNLTLLATLGIGVANAQSPTKGNPDNPIVGSGMDQYIKGANKPGYDMPNMSETACGTGEKRKIYDVLSDMKPLIINWEGFNCGNCRAHAGKTGKGMAENKDKVHFWLAFGALGDDATCNKTDGNSIGKWISDFPGYEHAFGFLDNDKTYCMGDYNLPQYLLIDPRTKKVVMNTTQNREGANAFPLILAEALKISNAITGINNTELNSATFSLYPNPFNNELQILTNAPNASKVSIYDVSGKEVFSTLITPSVENMVNLNQLDSGFYIAKLLDNSNNVLMVNKINKK